MYAAWILGVLLFDYGHVLPKVTVLVAHVASLIVALQAPDFFHARVVSAYSLFILNAIVLYSSRTFLSEEFAVVDALAALGPEGSRGLRAAVAGVLVAACAGCLAWLILG